MPDRVLAELGRAGDVRDASLDEIGVDVGGLRERETFDPVVHGGRMNRHGVESAGVHAELLGVPIAGHDIRTGNEGLRRYAVGQHARSAGAVRIDDRHIGVELRGHEGRLVSGRAGSDDHNAVHVRLPSSTRTYGAVVPTRCHQRISGRHDRHHDTLLVFSLTAETDYRHRRA